MYWNKILRTLFILSLIIMNIGCDQYSKSVVRERLEYNEMIEVLSDHVILTKVENAGAFLGMGSSMHPILRSIFLLIIPAIALIILLVSILVRTGLDKGIIIGLSFIIGGGIGNIFDRIVYGTVTDFLHIDLGFVGTGIFNMADVSVMIGTILILLYMVSRKRELPA
ncbi:signal peptidase II [Bacteroidota bacterium]